MFTANRNLYTDGSKTRLVEEGDPAARFLLVAKGQSISDHLAARYNLLNNAGPDVKAITPDDDQRIQNKAITPEADRRISNKARGRK